MGENELAKMVQTEWKKCFHCQSKCFCLSIFMACGSFCRYFIQKNEKEKKKNCDFMVNYKRLLGPRRLLRPLTASLLTFHQLFSTSPAPPGVVLIILLAGGNKPGLWAALVPQFRALMAASEWMRARGNPTGWSTGVRSAGVAAITSHHSLYWPPPIGFLLNLKHMQLFLLGGSNLKASLRRDKAPVQRSSSTPMCD